MDTLANLLSHRPTLAARPAVLFEDSTYTYADLDALSNKAAHALCREGVTAEDIVCQVVGSRPEQIVNLFGEEPSPPPTTYPFPWEK